MSLVRGLHEGAAVGLRTLCALSALLVACDGDGGRDEVDAGPVEDAGPDAAPIPCDDDDRDDDGDGFAGCLDCDDRNPAVSPAVNEGFCCSTNLDDGIDNDCDAEIDETPPLQGCSCFEGDDDADGYLDEFDCAPDDGTVNPGLTEGQWCSPDRFDDRDNDCDGETDESEETRPCDADWDGSPEEDDCDDLNGWVSPDRAESCCLCPDFPFDYRSQQCDGLDNDCDGRIDESPVCDCDEVDADYDGIRAGDDCDDTNPNLTPAYIECCCPDVANWFCNELDDDCDGEIDESSGTCCANWNGYEDF
jgi:hypothetical protein